MASSAAGNGSVLPTHSAAAPSAPAWPSSSKPKDHNNPRRRRCLCVCLLVTVAVLVALAITLVVLFLTVFRVRDPTTRLVSTRLAGVAPRLSFPAMSLQLNVTLLLSPNPASFDYDAGGHTDLTYRGAHVGDAQIDPGRIPSKGDGEVKLALTLQADRFAADLTQLLADVEAGSVAMEASTTIPGRVTVFGIFKRHAVAYSDCSFVLGVAEMAACCAGHGVCRRACASIFVPAGRGIPVLNEDGHIISDIHGGIAAFVASHSEASSSKSKCTLCLGTRQNDPTATTCGHVFCWNCIMEWCNEKPECPLCRTPITLIRA